MTYDHYLSRAKNRTRKLTKQVAINNYGRKLKIPRESVSFLIVSSLEGHINYKTQPNNNDEGL